MVLATVAIFNYERIIVSRMMASRGLGGGEAQQGEIVKISRAALGLVPRGTARLTEEQVRKLFSGVALPRPALVVVTAEEKTVAFTYVGIIPAVDVVIAYCDDPATLAKQEENFRAMAKGEGARILKIRGGKNVVTFAAEY